MTDPVRRLKNVAFALDETANAALGGSPRETISGTVGRAELAGKIWATPVACLINLIMLNPLHCAQAAAKEAELRRYAPDADPT